MDDRLREVISACSAKSQIDVVTDIPFITLLTLRDLRERDITLIRNFQNVIREQLGVDIVVVGGGHGCSKIHITVRNVPTDAAPAILNALLSLDIFREEARKAGFFSAYSPDIRISLDTGEIEGGLPAYGLLLFVSYSDADHTHLQELEKHLANLIRQGMISPWHRRKMPPRRWKWNWRGFGRAEAHT